jgi:hypothetical protein
MKLLVETTGPFQIYYPIPEQFARADRPCVITQSNPMSVAIAEGKLKLLGTVNDEATDEEFLAFLKDSKGKDLAVASFLSKFSDDEPEPKPARKPKAVAE